MPPIAQAAQNPQRRPQQWMPRTEYNLHVRECEEGRLAPQSRSNSVDAQIFISITPFFQAPDMAGVQDRGSSADISGQPLDSQPLLTPSVSFVHSNLLSYFPLVVPGAHLFRYVVVFCFASHQPLISPPTRLLDAYP